MQPLSPPIIAANSYPQGIGVEAAAHRDYLYRFALKKIYDRDLADDVVQDTLLAALETDDAYAGRASYRVWLVGILKHKIADAWRANGRTVSITAEDAEQSEDFDAAIASRAETAQPCAQSRAADPQHCLSMRQLLGQADAAMAALPRTVVDVFMAREVAGESTKEISLRLGLSEANIWVRVHRAKKALRACLGDARYAMP